MLGGARRTDCSANRGVGNGDWRDATSCDHQAATAGLGDGITHLVFDRRQIAPE